MFSLSLLLSGSRAAKHIHAKSPWRFPSIMIVPYSTFISTNYDVRKCLYIFSYVQNRWYVWLKNAWLIFYPSFIGSKHLLLPDSVHHHFFKMLRSIRPHSSWLVSSFWWDLLGLLVAAFYLTALGQHTCEDGTASWGPVLVVFWCVEWARGPLLGRQYTVGIVGRVLLVPYHTKYVDLTTWSNFRSQKHVQRHGFQRWVFLFFILNEGVGLFDFVVWV